MAEALALAARAGERGEVPVGAVVVSRGGELLGKGGNSSVTCNDPTAHAEILALRDAAARVGNYRLTDARLYATIEPCTMCLGAMVHARVAQVVFGAREPKAGALVSHDLLSHAGFNHVPEILEGVLAAEATRLMQGFFADRRTP